MGLISRVSSRTYRLQQTSTKTMIRVSRFLRQSAMNQNRIRDMHLARKGMDRDNFLHDANVGLGAYGCMAIWFGFWGYKTYCQYILNLEHRYLRLPISERKQYGRIEPEMWLMQRDCLNERSEGFEVWKSIWKIM